MGAPRIRPTFEISADLSRRQIVDRLAAGLREAEESIDAMFVVDKIELVPHASKVHLWSPQLTLVLDETDGRTVIRGRFAPHPHVWSLYLAVHALGAFGTIAAAMFGVSQYLAGQSPWALWALPVSPLLAALVWALAFVGQGLGSEQMFVLRRFVEESLERRDGQTVGDGFAAPVPLGYAPNSSGGRTTVGGKRRPSARRGADRFEIRVGTETLVVLSTPIADGAVLEELTPAEREVASAVLRGLSNEEVARLRGCRPRTVAVQLASIYKKLGIASRSELAALVGGSR